MAKGRLAPRNIQMPREPGIWHALLTPSLGRQRQADLCEFKANLVYRVSFRTARVM